MSGAAEGREEFGAGLTGSVRVDEALTALAQAAGTPPAEQVAPLTEVDQALRETLDTIGDV